MTSNINSFHASSEALVTEANASRGLLALELVMDDSKTLAAQVGTMANASISEAEAERNSLICQATASAAQAAGQLFSAGAIAGTTLYGNYNSKVSGLTAQQSGLQSNLDELENLQSKMRTTNPAAAEISADGEGASLDPAVEERLQQMQDGSFTPASKPISNVDPNLDVDAEAFSHLKATDPAQYTSVKDDLSNQVKDLNNQINTCEQQISGIRNNWNMVGNFAKEGASAFSATAQSVTQGLQSSYVYNKIASQNVINMLQSAAQVLTKIVDSASQNVDSSQSAVVQAAQLVASSA